MTSLETSSLENYHGPRTRGASLASAGPPASAIHSGSLWWKSGSNPKVPPRHLDHLKINWTALGDDQSSSPQERPKLIRDNTKPRGPSAIKQKLQIRAHGPTNKECEMNVLLCCCGGCCVRVGFGLYLFVSAVFKRPSDPGRERLRDHQNWEGTV